MMTKTLTNLLMVLLKTRLKSELAEKRSGPIYTGTQIQPESDLSHIQIGTWLF